MAVLNTKTWHWYLTKQMKGLRSNETPSNMINHDDLSFVSLGVSVKSRCFGMLSHSSSLSRQAKTVIFISKITISKTYPILHFESMRTYNILYCPKKERYNCHLACHNHLYPSRWLLVSTNYRLARWCT